MGFEVVMTVIIAVISALMGVSFVYGTYIATRGVFNEETRTQRYISGILAVLFAACAIGAFAAAFGTVGSAFDTRERETECRMLNGEYRDGKCYQPLQEIQLSKR